MTQVREVQGTLDELLTLLGELKQARWKLAPSDGLRHQLEMMAGEYVVWVRRLADEAELRGIDLANELSTVAGRRLPDLFPGDVDHGEVVAFFEEHLAAEAERVREHRLGVGDDETLIALFDEVADGLDRHRDELRATG